MNNLEIYKWIYRAYQFYKDNINHNRYIGMCSSFAVTISVQYKSITDIIPEYNYEFFKGTPPKIINTLSYWWPREEVIPRLEAFNTLLSIYWKKLSFIQKIKVILYRIYF